MTKLTESAIEDFAIKLFVRLGYDYIHAPGGDPLPVQADERRGVRGAGAGYAGLDV